MGLGSAIRVCFRKALTFSGRAARPEFWWFVLFVLLGGWAVTAIDVALVGPADLGPVSAVFHLVVLVPLIAAAWRRMHDTGRSGLFVIYPLIVLVGLTSFVGFLGGADVVWSAGLSGVVAGLGGMVAAFAAIVLMISPLLVLWWLSRPSQPRANRWGPMPGRVSVAPASAGGDSRRSDPPDSGPWSSP